MYQEINRRSDLTVKQDDMLASKRFVIERKPDTVYFYELEEAVVLDVILDETHPEFNVAELDPADWPPNIDGSPPAVSGPNYGLIGKIRFRLLHSELGHDKETLHWAFPIENTGVSEYPLMNEVVIVGKYMNKYFYSRKLNTKQVINSNAAFVTERVSGYVDKNFNTYVGPTAPFDGPNSKMNVDGGPNYEGVLGNYFKFNHHIRALKRYEGDTILESRFGASIRFGAYDDVRGNDVGAGGEYGNGAGNPMILIRNRQAPVKNEQGFTAKGYTSEDINKDGSSIHFTSGKTISKFKPTTKFQIYSGLNPVDMPKLGGDQVIINSDRLVFSSKANEMLFYSKKYIGMVTDAELSLAAKKKVTITTMETATINAPKIYLGDHGNEEQPALLGRTTVAWMYASCEWMLSNLDTQMEILTTLMAHKHLAKGVPTSPPMPPELVKMTKQLAELGKQRMGLMALRDQLNSLMSSRVFVSKGG